ncbi:hypothetical protein SALBM217S_09886 [Streptomyces griseoloalbus]
MLTYAETVLAARREAELTGALATFGKIAAGRAQRRQRHSLLVLVGLRGSTSCAADQATLDAVVTGSSALPARTPSGPGSTSTSYGSRSRPWSSSSTPCAASSPRSWRTGDTGAGSPSWAPARALREDHHPGDQVRLRPHRRGRGPAPCALPPATPTRSPTSAPTSSPRTTPTTRPDTSTWSPARCWRPAPCGTPAGSNCSCERRRLRRRPGPRHPHGGPSQGAAPPHPRQPVDVRPRRPARRGARCGLPPTHRTTSPTRTWHALGQGNTVATLLPGAGVLHPRHLARRPPPAGRGGLPSRSPRTATPARRSPRPCRSVSPLPYGTWG